LSVLALAMYRLFVNADQKDEIAASVAAHRDLGPSYDEAVAQGLVERIGEEIDKRVDARMGHVGSNAVPPRQAPQAPAYQAAAPGYQPPPTRRQLNIAGPIVALGSIGLGLGATAIVVSHLAHSGLNALGAVLLVWAAIAIINIAYARRR
jgi:hypothetical protein